MASEWEVLDRWALDLVKNERIPIDIGSICGRLSAEVVDVPESSRPTIERGDHGVRIRLPRKDSQHGYNSRERFVIAHEIAHLLLVRSRFSLPHGVGDYWRYETICNHFAGQLLLPDTELRAYLKKLPNVSCVSLLRSLPDLARIARIMWETAAYRVAEISGIFDFFVINALRFKPDPLFLVRVSTIPRRTARGAHIEASSSLAAFLASIRRAGVPYRIPANVLTDRLVLEKFQFLSSVNEAVVVRVSSTDFHVALHWKSVGDPR